MTIGRFVCKTAYNSNCRFTFFGYLGQFSTNRIASICAILPEMIKVSKTTVAVVVIFAKTSVVT
jgi:hypothetical protein